MNTKDEKILMFEAAIMYYEKKFTQQKIANVMNLSRQTVSKLLNDAVKEKIVEINIHNPQKVCQEFQLSICKKFNIHNCIITSVSSKNESLRTLMTIKAAVEYIAPILNRGNQKIALSWGRTIQELINTMPQLNTTGNVVFPLFGATDNENSYFSSNELARSMADKIGADIKYAWFPYIPDSSNDCRLIKNLSYYKKMQNLWNSADISVLGIGNTEILDIFGKTFGYGKNHSQAIGDIATHFFNKDGELLDLYENSLCASAESIKNTPQTIAIACGDNKATAISGALRTNIIDTLITDEYTARKVLENT